MTIKAYGSIEKFLDEFLLEDVQAMAAQIDRELINETPKDTVQAAGNWTVSVVSPNDVAPDTKSTGVAISTGQEKINSLKKKQRLFIQNMTPYIQRLDEGHSLQAPSGFVQRIITRATNMP